MRFVIHERGSGILVERWHERFQGQVHWMGTCVSSAVVFGVSSGFLVYLLHIVFKLT